MKITKTQLKRIIKEEIGKVMIEGRRDRAEAVMQPIKQEVSRILAKLAKMNPGGNQYAKSGLKKMLKARSPSHMLDTYASPEHEGGWGNDYGTVLDALEEDLPTEAERIYDLLVQHDKSGEY